MAPGTGRACTVPDSRTHKFYYPGFVHTLTPAPDFNVCPELQAPKASVYRPAPIDPGLSSLQETKDSSVPSDCGSMMIPVYPGIKQS